jgi:hypothetical protein
MKNVMNLVSVAAVTFAASASQGAIVQYSASLDGYSESPPNSSYGYGDATFDYDTITHTLAMSVYFYDLAGTTTVAHIHANTAVSGTGTAGVASGLAGFPTGVKTGSYFTTIYLLSASSYNSSYLAANGGTAASAETALLASMSNGKAYLNLHSTSYPGGEIRGFIYLVPAPGMISLIGMCGVLTGRRRR